MKSRRLHVLLLCAALSVGCKTGSGSSSGKSGASGLDPQDKVAEMDGQPVTYAQLQADKDVGPRMKKAELKALNDLYEARRNAAEELVNRRLLEGEAKAKGKTVEQWLQTDYLAGFPEATDAQAKAFYEEHKAEIPNGQSYEQLEPRIKQVLRQNQTREALGKHLEELRKQHKVQIALQPPARDKVQVEAKGPVRGAAAAPITIVEFSDFQCPFCSREIPVIERVLKEYDGKVKVVFRHFPLDIHPNAAKAAEAGACANEQGKFWELHDKLFASQQKLAVDDLKGYAKALGLDGRKFDECLDSGRMKASVDADQKAGADAGVTGTPAFFIDGTPVEGAVPYEQFKQAIDRELQKKG